jgi:hypothetical protein
MVQAVKRTHHHISCLLLLACAFAPASASAHVLDEYLQATLVEIAPDAIHLQINLTPGVQVAEPIVALMDPDQDGVISPSEAAHYANLFKRDLQAWLDDRKVELTLVSSRFATPAELRTGWGMVELEFSIAATGTLAAGEHRLVLENRHQPQVSVYLFNAEWPTSTWVSITRQTRNENQSRGEIAFTYHPPASASRTGGVFPALAGVLVVVVVAGTGIWWLRKGDRAGAIRYHQ